MHAAIDQAVDRVGRQVRKHKEKQQGHRPKPQDLLPEDVVPETAEPTFDQAVDEIDQGGN